METIITWFLSSLSLSFFAFFFLWYFPSLFLGKRCHKILRVFSRKKKMSSNFKPKELCPLFLLPFFQLLSSLSSCWWLSSSFSSSFTLCWNFGEEHLNLLGWKKYTKKVLQKQEPTISSCWTSKKKSGEKKLRKKESGESGKERNWRKWKRKTKEEKLWA